MSETITQKETIKKFNSFISSLEKQGVVLELVTSNVNDLADIRLYKVKGKQYPWMLNICVAIFDLNFKVFIESGQRSEGPVVEELIAELEKYKGSYM